MYLKTTEKATVENYPYGFRLKTTAFYSIEHKKGKGFRSVFQTINPKTGKLNKPKCSTYSPVKVLKEVDGRIGTYSLDFYGNEGIEKDVQFMFEHFDLFTPAQNEDIARHIMMVLKVDIAAKATYCGSDVKKLFPLYDPAMNTLVEIAKTGKNLFDKVKIDFEAVKALEIKDFKPFKVTSYGIN